MPPKSDPTLIVPRYRELLLTQRCELTESRPKTSAKRPFVSPTSNVDELRPDAWIVAHAAAPPRLPRSARLVDKAEAEVCDQPTAQPGVDPNGLCDCTRRARKVG
jgi:hypothetical protein